ncbi:MAG: phosphate ABC transporter substrate-binding protein [Eubacterium sp.]|nr:phosphate ABC transporter substrate-binding protein [Eubacterium sp.]
MKRRELGKIASLILAGVLAGGLAACGGSASDASSAASTTEAASAAEDTAAESEAAEDTEAADDAAADDAAAEEGGSTVKLDENAEGEITAAGSSALQPLADAAAKEFMTQYPGVVITVDAGGSGTGIQNVSDGTVTIGNSDVYAEEKLDDPEKAKELVDHKVCAIGFAAVVSQDVYDSGVTNLTSDQLTKIFTGEITNWKDVNGEDKEITLITRPDGSGTRATFEKVAMGGAKELDSANQTDNSTELQTMIQTTEGSIGYLAFSYTIGAPADGVCPVAVDGVEPTLENVYSGDYKIWAFEHMYTKGDPDEVTQAYLDYIMNDYSDQVESQGYCVSNKLTKTDGY